MVTISIKGCCYIKLVLLCLCFCTTSMAQSLTLETQWGNDRTAAHRTDGIFAVWWDKRWDHYKDAGIILAELNSVRAQALNLYGMQDPPSVDDNKYTNIYIHHHKRDIYPDTWANGVGTDRWGRAFMTLPIGMHTSLENLSHEGFHIFQYKSTIPYSGDSGWFIEATANWNKVNRHPKGVIVLDGASALVHHPQLPLWHSGFFNLENGEEHTWGRGMHQYGMNTFLNYLTGERGVPAFLIGNSFYANIQTTPQEYLHDQIGRQYFMRYWLDFVAQLAGDYGYLSAEQKRYAERGWQKQMRGKNDDQRYVSVLSNTGTAGRWIRPDKEHVTKGWSYNSYKINNSKNTRYSFHLNGDAAGDAGTTGVFRGVVVVKNGNNKTYHYLNMSNEQDGSVSISASPSDSEIYFLVTAVPRSFNGNQRYYYSVKIDEGAITAPEPEPPTNPGSLAKVFDCVERGYVNNNSCDWNHWSQMYQACDFSAYPELDQNVFIRQVKAGNCRKDNWNNLKRKLSPTGGTPANTKLRKAVACVAEYVRKGTCDWSHWGELYMGCKTYNFPEMDKNDFLLYKVARGECTRNNWPNIEKQILGSTGPSNPSNPPSPPSGTRSVVVIAGQSNAEGNVMLPGLRAIANAMPTHNNSLNNVERSALHRASKTAVGVWCEGDLSRAWSVKSADATIDALRSSSLPWRSITDNYRHRSVRIRAANYHHIKANKRNLSLHTPRNYNVGPLAAGYAGSENRDTGIKFGPELGFGLRFGKAHPDTSLLKVTMGGSSLGDHWRPDGALYQALVKETAATVKAENAKLAGLIWFQGWNDQYKGIDGKPLWEGYEDNLRRLINNYRRDTNTDVPVVIVKSQGGGSALQAVAQAQQNVADSMSNVSIVESGDLTRCFHYDSGSQLVIGERAARALEGML